MCSYTSTQYFTTIEWGIARYKVVLKGNDGMKVKAVVECHFDKTK